MALEMKHCMQCGSELVLKELKDEGMVPYCRPVRIFVFQSLMLRSVWLF